jgi:hypothetical protein
MKKLALFLMIPALALLGPSTAPAFYFHHWGGIHGTYAMTATGSCLHSKLGFNANLTPITGEGSVVWGATVMAQAIWTFESDGTGTVSGTNYVLDFPPGSPVFGGSIARQNPISFNFHYEMTHDGAITVYPPLPPNPVGMISQDHQTLTLTSANQVQAVGALGYAICNVGRVLIRVKDAEE